MAPLKTKGDMAEPPDIRLERVQVKYATSDGRSIPVRTCSHSLTNGRVRATKRYTSETIDWLAVFDATTEGIFYIPAAELGAGMRELTLRLSPAKNNQRARVRMANDYRVPTITPTGP